MKYLFPASFLFLLIFTSCNYSEKSAALDLREQKLHEKEKEFALKETEYRNLQRMRDSIFAERIETKIINLPSNIIGKWNGKIVCTDSTCPENKIGDIRTDTWEFVENGNIVSVKVTNRSGNVRVYTGSYSGSEIRLHYSTDSSAVRKSDINIVLNDFQENKIKGIREATGDGNCISRFSVDLEKSKN